MLKMQKMPQSSRSGGGRDYLLCLAVEEVTVPSRLTLHQSSRNRSWLIPAWDRLFEEEDTTSFQHDFKQLSYTASHFVLKNREQEFMDAADKALGFSIEVIVDPPSIEDGIPSFFVHRKRSKWQFRSRYSRPYWSR